MIVDDEPENLKVLESMLRRARYKVVPFSSGASALADAPALQPDIILLDINMPGMDGYEVCRRLKCDPVLKDIPIIFLSGMTDIQDKVKAFDAGGADYVTKPFSGKEVLARLRTHLETRYTRMHLDELVQERTVELEAAHRRLRLWDEAKTHWIHMLAHELRTPLTAVFCTAHVLFKKAPPDDDLGRMQQDFELSCARLNKLIDDAITLATIDADIRAFETEEVPLSRFLAKACLRAKRQAPDVNFSVSEDRIPEQTLTTDPELLLRALSDLLVTASCCTPHGENVTLSANLQKNVLTVEIATPGKGLPAEALDTFFEVGGQRALLKSGADYGLGPALAQRIVQLCNGDVTVRNGDQRGIVIGIRLPLRCGLSNSVKAPFPIH